jgi:hypothetical protein
MNSNFKLILKVFAKISILFLIIQSFFWIILVIYPETITVNMPQEIGYNFINPIIHNKNLANNRKVIAIGDSTVAASVHIKQFGPDTLTLGVWGSSTAELYFYLETYLKNHTAPKCILFSHIYSPEYYQEHAFWEFIAPYSDLSFENVVEIYDQSKAMNSFPGNDSSKLFYLTKFYATKYKLFFAAQNIYKDKLKYRNQSKEIYDLIKKGIVHSEGQYIRFQRGNEIRGVWWSFLEKPLPENKYFKYYLDKSMTLAKEKNIKIYTFSPPVSKFLYNQYTDRLDQLDNVFAELPRKYSNVTHLPLRKFYNYDQYIDDAHLNFYGSRLFTSDILDATDCK